MYPPFNSTSIHAEKIGHAEKFGRLIENGLVSEDEITAIFDFSVSSSAFPEELLIARGIPKHEIMFCLSEYYGLPVLEYEESTVIARSVMRSLDMERLKSALWVPLSRDERAARVIAYLPDDPAVAEDIRRTLGDVAVEYMVALPSDIVRIIENSLDLNPGFPPAAGRTPLAKVRTYLAGRRSMLASHRTQLARGRTGLAFLRTGISFMAVAVLLFRVFGFGYAVIPEAALLAAGLAIAVDGLSWYFPIRKADALKFDCGGTEPTWGTTVLEARDPGDDTVLARTGPVEGADELRARWSDLSPVMRRRYLASDRTDLAEERTVLACYRTNMARARTGLAFSRTGVAFAGLGIALLRQFRTGPWTLFDAFLIIAGTVMAVEGFHWYIPGRRAGVKGMESVRGAEVRKTIWDFVLPPVHKTADEKALKTDSLPVRASHAPGIWGTTGLALERTVLAERRNVMARLRTVMARARTGLAFIRTGMSIASVGMGLLVYFGMTHHLWAALYIALVAAGLLLVADGIYWYVPAERTRRQYPYCFGDMEISIPDYGAPSRFWPRAVFSHDN